MFAQGVLAKKFLNIVFFYSFFARLFRHSGNCLNLHFFLVFFDGIIWGFVPLKVKKDCRFCDSLKSLSSRLFLVFNNRFFCFSRFRFNCFFCYFFGNFFNNNFFSFVTEIIVISCNFLCKLEALCDYIGLRSLS